MIFVHYEVFVNHVDRVTTTDDPGLAIREAREYKRMGYDRVKIVKFTEEDVTADMMGGKI